MYMLQIGYFYVAATSRNSWHMHFKGNGSFQSFAIWWSKTNDSMIQKRTKNVNEVPKSNPTGKRNPNLNHVAYPYLKSYSVVYHKNLLYLIMVSLIIVSSNRYSPAFFIPALQYSLKSQMLYQYHSQTANFHRSTVIFCIIKHQMTNGDQVLVLISIEYSEINYLVGTTLITFWLITQY